MINKCDICPLTNVTVCPIQERLYDWRGLDGLKYCEMYDALKKLVEHTIYYSKFGEKNKKKC